MNDSETTSVLGISGSLRVGSYNSALLHAAVDVAPAGMTIDIVRLNDIPVYNEDVRAQGWPEAVATLRRRISAADAILIATPEYNYSVPGALKNAVDWASRPPEQPFEGKPVAIMGASPGRLGTARAQYHLRQCFVYLNSSVLNKPEVMVGGAPSLFDDAGELTDDETRERVSDLLLALAKAVRLARGAAE